MKRLVRITIAAVLGAQVVFWIAVVLWLNLRPQVPEDPEQRAREMEVGNIIVVKMNDSLRFVPTEITIKAGDTVEWRNVGVVPHTVTADPARAPSSRNIELPAGAQPFDSGWVTRRKWFRYTFNQPRVYQYICLPHERAGMLGTVIVG